MEPQYNNLTYGESMIVSWQYRYLGGFWESMFDAIKQADDNNLDHLERAFPEVIQAYKNYSRTPGWWDDVRHRAGL